MPISQICNVCNISYINYGISQHKIDANPNKYIGLCKICRSKKPCKFCGKDFIHHQNQTCSKICAENLKKKTYIESCGTPHNFSKDSLSRQSFTNKLIFVEGIHNVFQRSEVIRKIENTVFTRYGVSNISKHQSIIDRKRKSFAKTVKENPELFKNAWWKAQPKLIAKYGKDPRLGMFGKSSKESLQVFLKLYDWCKKIGISDSDIYLGIDSKSEYFIHTGKRIYFYDFCVRSLNLIIEFHGIGFHANPKWSKDKLSKWRQVFTNETARLNINRTKVKNKIANRKGFTVFEIWGDISPNKNLKDCQSFILNRL